MLKSPLTSVLKRKIKPQNPIPSCNVANVAHFDEENGDPLCDQCCLQKKKGSFCPLCEGCYDDNDYEARMMECDTCG